VAHRTRRPVPRLARCLLPLPQQLPCSSVRWPSVPPVTQPSRTSTNPVSTAGPVHGHVPRPSRIEAASSIAARKGRERPPLAAAGGTRGPRPLSTYLRLPERLCACCAQQDSRRGHRAALFGFCFLAEVRERRDRRHNTRQTLQQRSSIDIPRGRGELQPSAHLGGPGAGARDPKCRQCFRDWSHPTQPSRGRPPQLHNYSVTQKPVGLVGRFIVAPWNCRSWPQCTLEVAHPALAVRGNAVGPPRPSSRTALTQPPLS